MAIRRAVIEPMGDGDIVLIEGDVEEIENLIGREAVEDVLVAGYSVKNMFTAEHDGHPAVRLTLTADRTEVGRLVLRTDVATEYSFEFAALFDNENEAQSFVKRVKERPALPKVVAVTQDLAYEEESLEECIAQMSADFGVSISVLELEGPGGGWPLVKIVGYADKVRTILHDAWGMTDPDIDASLKPASL